MIINFYYIYKGILEFGSHVLCHIIYITIPFFNQTSLYLPLGTMPFK